MEQAFIAYLLAFTGLKNLIGNKIYPEEIPQSTTLPAVYWIKISDVKEHLLSGQCKTERPVYQFTAQALTKSAAKAVTELIKKALCDYQGLMGGVEVQKIELESEGSGMYASPDGTIKVYVEDLEFQITFVKE